MSTSTLTVLFEDPFWIGLFEQTDHEGLHVCKVTFGAEPTEKEVMEFIDKNWNQLQFSQAVDVAQITEIRKNPQATTSRSKETDAVAGYRYQVAAGLCRYLSLQSITSVHACLQDWEQDCPSTTTKNAFTAGASLGNPAACVFTGQETLSPEQMQAVAREHKGLLCRRRYIVKLS